MLEVRYRLKVVVNQQCEVFAHAFPSHPQMSQRPSTSCPNEFPAFSQHRPVVVIVIVIVVIVIVIVVVFVVVLVLS